MDGSKIARVAFSIGKRGLQYLQPSAHELRYIVRVYAGQSGAAALTTPNVKSLWI